MSDFKQAIDTYLNLHRHTGRIRHFRVTDKDNFFKHPQTMSNPIWTVVTGNLAEQIAATQGGVVHPTQLLPYLPLSLSQIEATLNELCSSGRIQKQLNDGLAAYIFTELFDQAPHKFAPTHCVYSNEELDGHEFAIIAPEIKTQIEAELGHLATHENWPSLAVWEHELIYLAQNLPAPVIASRIAGRSRLSLKKVEQRLSELKERGLIQFNSESCGWELPPARYPRPAYKKNDQFIRQFPSALQEETEVRLLKGLSSSLLMLLLFFAVALTAKIPFPLIFFGGIASAALVFLKIFKATTKPLPEV
jgi:hypothetical protein